MACSSTSTSSISTEQGRRKGTAKTEDEALSCGAWHAHRSNGASLVCPQAKISWELRGAVGSRGAQGPSCAYLRADHAAELAEVRKGTSAGTPRGLCQ